MLKDLKVRHLMLEAAAEGGEVIIGDETSLMKISSAGIKVYTAARYARNGAGKQ